MNDQDGRLARLEQVIATDDSETGPLMYFADKNSEFQSQIDVLKGKSFSNEVDMSKTMVVGGLQGRASLQSAMKWLHDKLEALNVPCPNEIYMNAQSFNGVVVAKYYFSFTRDVAIATLRSANIKHDQQQVWANPGPSHSDSCKKNVLIRSTLAAW